MTLMLRFLKCSQKPSRLAAGFLLCLAFCRAQAAAADIPLAASAASVFSFSGFMSSWRQSCQSGSCSIPQPLDKNRPVKFSLPAPSAAGNATAAKHAETFSLDDGRSVNASVSVYAVCPQAGQSPSELCPGLYFQAQIELSGAAQAVCGAMFNPADAVPFPVLVCAGGAADGRLGITLHRNPL